MASKIHTNEINVCYDNILRCQKTAFENFISSVDKHCSDIIKYNKHDHTVASCQFIFIYDNKLVCLDLINVDDYTRDKTGVVDVRMYGSPENNDYVFNRKQIKNLFSSLYAGNNIYEGTFSKFSNLPVITIIDHRANDAKSKSIDECLQKFTIDGSEYELSGNLQVGNICYRQYSQRNSEGIIIEFREAEADDKSLLPSNHYIIYIRAGGYSQNIVSYYSCYNGDNRLIYYPERPTERCVNAFNLAVKKIVNASNTAMALKPKLPNDDDLKKKGDEVRAAAKVYLDNYVCLEEVIAKQKTIIEQLTNKNKRLKLANADNTEKLTTELKQKDYNITSLQEENEKLKLEIVELNERVTATSEREDALLRDSILLQDEKTLLEERLENILHVIQSNVNN